MKNSKQTAWRIPSGFKLVRAGVVKAGDILRYKGHGRARVFPAAPPFIGKTVYYKFGTDGRGHEITKTYRKVTKSC